MALAAVLALLGDDAAASAHVGARLQRKDKETKWGGYAKSGDAHIIRNGGASKLNGCVCVLNKGTCERQAYLLAFL